MNLATVLLRIKIFEKFTILRMIEGSGSGSGSGSIPLTNGSGSGSRRPKNVWIRIRIRIRNTVQKYGSWDLDPSSMSRIQSTATIYYIHRFSHTHVLEQGLWQRPEQLPKPAERRKQWTPQPPLPQHPLAQVRRYEFLGHLPGFDHILLEWTKMPVPKPVRYRN